MVDTPISKVSLQFPPDVEASYREETYPKELKQVRINIAMAWVVYSLFALLDAWVTPQVRHQTWFIRFAIVTPVVFATLALSYTKYFKRYQQLIVSFLVLVGGGGIVAFIAFTYPIVPHLHFAGLLLVFMCAYLAFKLRFLYATVTCWAIIGMYEITDLLYIHSDLGGFLTDNFFYISANLLGMFANYQREMYLRKEFLQARFLQELKQQKHDLEKDVLNRAVDQAVQSLKESEALFRSLAESTSASIIIHRGGRFLYANHAVQTITGYTEDELLNMDFWAVVHKDHRDMVRERGQARLSGKTVPLVYELKIATKKGDERWATASAGFVQYKGAPAVIVTLFDITDRKRAEDERTRLYEERIREEKRHLREKELIMMDLHDGVGGITTNIGILAELAQKSDDTASAKKTLATISQLSREGVSEIRCFMQGLDTSEMSWHALATEIKTQGAAMLEPHGISFAINTSVQEDIEGKPGSRLFVNLFKIVKETLTNIIKHANATSVSATLSITENKLRCCIHDNGSEPLRTPSLGRGLVNMRKRAAELGGTITFSSDVGTRVDLEIPLSVQPPLVS